MSCCCACCTEGSSTWIDNFATTPTTGVIPYQYSDCDSPGMRFYPPVHPESAFKSRQVKTYYDLRSQMRIRFAPGSPFGGRFEFTWQGPRQTEMLNQWVLPDPIVGSGVTALRCTVINWLVFCEANSPANSYKRGLQYDYYLFKKLVTNPFGPPTIQKWIELRVAGISATGDSGLPVRGAERVLLPTGSQQKVRFDVDPAPDLVERKCKKVNARYYAYLDYFPQPDWYLMAQNVPLTYLNKSNCAIGWHLQVSWSIEGIYASGQPYSFSPSLIVGTLATWGPLW